VPEFLTEEKSPLPPVTEKDTEGFHGERWGRIADTILLGTCTNQSGWNIVVHLLFALWKGTLILCIVFLSAAAIGGLVRLWLSGNARCLNSNCRF
jgi:hypothetical protein